MTPNSKNTDDAGRESRAMSALQNGLAVLRSFTVEEPLQGVSEIASKVGLHKSTVSRILAFLETEELVERDPATRRFRLGLGVIALAGPLLANLDVRRVAYPVLVELSQRTAETAALMMWDGSEAVCVEQVPSRHQVKHTTPLGTRYRDAASASVQAFLAGQDEFTARSLLMSGAITYPGLDQAGLDAYLVRLGEVADRGYAVNYGETSLDEVGVAAPVVDHRGKLVASVLLSAPRYRVSSDQVPVIGEAVAQAAREITARLGGAAATD
ncbi:IclR family transcriptional regulator [Planosporangium thailandense]|uniref:IclR family transcriptional regulator n=1 Tax=Planosporangium thailandense TaxID=765197 RepID=A0ABX0XZS9_9ACTN|nr:IclR family transcriptional regulator [Planosporangium thailandense]NJC71321.1 IclR family transcriptional regulator [Planosporangium thailandense]